MSTINSALVDRIVAEFRQRFGSAPEFIARAPGRVNLLGEHVDYNDGFVMPTAIDRATYVAFSRSSYEFSHIEAFDLHEIVELSNDSITHKKQKDGSLLPEWGLYPAGVAQILIEDGFGPEPINAFFASDVPRGSGLSSSASVEVAFLTAWQQLGGWSLEKMRRARLCQKAEIEYVGVNCGIMDQFASVCGEENKILCLDCQSLDWKTLNFPAGVAIVIADTTVRRKLTSGGYNTRHDECKAALRFLQQKMPGVTSFRDVSITGLDRYSNLMPEVIAKRARHVISEIDRTIKAQVILERGDIRAFGRLINEAHSSLRDFYEVSCSELDTMVSIAQSLEGCIGARLTGAGFGGCTVNLVDIDVVEIFMQQLANRYEQATRLIPAVYLTQASDGAEIQ
jgi:galactokinase